jgi:hypothetical protein
MDFVIILVTRRARTPASTQTPQHFICEYKNTFQDDMLPLSEGTDIRLWGAVPKQLIAGVLGSIVKHRKYWVEVKIERTEVFAHEPTYILRLPIATITLPRTTTIYRSLIYPLLESEPPKFPPTKRLSPLFDTQGEIIYARPWEKK